MPKKTTDLSKITDIKGVGPSLSDRIQETLDVESVEELASFSEDQLTQVKGIGSGKANNISEQLESFVTRCDRCGEEYIAEESCPNCMEELKEELEHVKEDVESLEVDPEEKRDLEETMEEIESNINEGEIEQGFDLLEKTKDELSKFEEVEFKKISDLEGVGPTFAERIKETLEVESVEELASFSEGDLREVKGIGKGKAENISDQLDSFREVCQRCGQSYVDEDNCPTCTEELREEVELVKKNLKSLKQDVDPEGRWDLDEKIDDIESKLSDGEFEETTELLDFTKDELAAAEQLYTVLLDIETTLEKESKLINRHTYQDGRDSMIKSLRRGNYHRAGKKAEKIQEYVEKEKKFHDMENSQLKRLNIEEFSRDMMGLGRRTGENIYGEGFHTLKDVYKAGKQKLMKSGIDEKTSDRLMKILDPIFQDMDIEKDLVEEGPEEEKEKRESKEESVFKETEEETVEKEEELEEGKVVEGREEEQIEAEAKEIETKSEKPADIKKSRAEKVEDKTKETPTTSDLFGEEELGMVEVEEVEFKYWLPPILIPIILAIAGYLLFFM